MAEVVLRSRVDFLDMQGWEYHITSSPLRKGREVSRSEALAYIKEHSLVKAYSCEYGDVYDTPDKEFYRVWHRAVKENLVRGGVTFRQSIDNVWKRF